MINNIIYFVFSIPLIIITILTIIGLYGLIFTIYFETDEQLNFINIHKLSANEIIDLIE
jgi:hypothetical protein